MAKVLPFVLVLVLVVSVSFFMIPTQEQPANAYIRPYPPSDLFAGKTYATSGWLDAPENGFFFTMKCFDNSLLPRLEIIGQASDGSSAGVINFVPYKFGDEYMYYLFDAELNTAYYPVGSEYTISFYSIFNSPIRYHSFVYRVDGVSYYKYVYFEKEVSKFCVNFLDQDGQLHTVQDLRTSPYHFDNFVISASRGILESKYINNIVSFSDNQIYQEGFIAGANSTNSAVVNAFPALIGSIFAFFASIATYEVLGISLLNIMIIVGSVLLLLAVLRVFLK